MWHEGVVDDRADDDKGGAVTAVDNCSSNERKRLSWEVAIALS